MKRRSKGKVMRCVREEPMYSLPAPSSNATKSISGTAYPRDQRFHEFFCIALSIHSMLGFPFVVERIRLSAIADSLSWWLLRAMCSRQCIAGTSVLPWKGGLQKAKMWNEIQCSQELIRLQDWYDVNVECCTEYTTNNRWRNLDAVYIYSLVLV